MDSFLINALLSGLGIALITGLLGCFIVWKQMAYFGDSLGHSAILGIGIGILFGIDYSISISIFVVIFAITISYLKNKEVFSSDVILGILAHGSLALGIIIISTNDDPSFNLHTFLFGDILSVSKKEIISIFVAIPVIYGVIFINWNKLIINIISVDLARSQKISVYKTELILTLVIALAVTMSIKVIGAFLVTSLLIIPAATARNLARNPKNMVIISVIISILSILIGILASYHFDIPSGPAIILSSFVIFFVLILLKKHDS